MTGLMGVAISTTGAEHRMDLLAESVARWRRALPSDGASLFVTVDGSAADAERVRQAVYDWTGSVYRVGQPHNFTNTYGVPVDLGQPKVREGRLGVAVNKNTGLELLMDQTQAEHLFLCDDDTWPRFPQSLTKHTEFEYGHSMVCWGAHRHERLYLDESAAYSGWTWPRGVMLYQTRAVVERVGGMVEKFGLGGHEHAEYSLRIHNAGFTPAPFISPASYATRRAMGADALWHCEDMPRLNEARHVFHARQDAHTTLPAAERDWDRIHKTMHEQEGSADFVPYWAANWGRASATLCSSTTSLGAEQ